MIYILKILKIQIIISKKEIKLNKKILTTFLLLKENNLINNLLYN